MLRQILNPGAGSRPVSVGANPHPTPIRPNIDYGRTGRPMSIGQGTGRAPGWAPPQNGGCWTYTDPRVPVDENGCPRGFNGCGDLVGVNSGAVAAGATVTIEVSAAIVMTPRYFVYTGPAASFDILNVRVANGPDSQFGAGISADIYRFDSFTDRGVAWPTFYNSPGLLLTITNTTGAPATFSGAIVGTAVHQ